MDIDEKNELLYCGCDEEVLRAWSLKEWCIITGSPRLTNDLVNNQANRDKHRLHIPIDNYESLHLAMAVHPVKVDGFLIYKSF